MSTFPDVRFELPGWINNLDLDEPVVCRDVESQARFVIELALRNMREQSGGPFGAAVFDIDSGALVAPGVNLVVPAAAAVAHAEIVAIAVAGSVQGEYDLGAAGARRVLVASTEPCAMCFGSVHWSGVSRLVCSARDEDARAVGFDEGPKMEDWVERLEARGVEVIRDVERTAAVEVLNEYVVSGGTIYNGRQEP